VGRSEGVKKRKSNKIFFNKLYSDRRPIKTCAVSDAEEKLSQIFFAEGGRERWWPTGGEVGRLDGSECSNLANDLFNELTLGAKKKMKQNL